MTETRLEQGLRRLAAKIGSYGKENLEDILHVAAEAVNLITGQNRCRIYLEDLTSGTLTCAMSTGIHANTIRRQAFPITSTDYVVSRVYVTQEEAQVENMGTLPSSFARSLAERFAVAASYIFPLLHRGRGIGVICIDSGRRGQLPDEEARRRLRSLFDEVTPIIDQARLYHQQIVLARNVDAAKKREAARTMVKSAVRLIDRLALASVLVPTPRNVKARGRGWKCSPPTRRTGRPAASTKTRS